MSARALNLNIPSGGAAATAITDAATTAITVQNTGGYAVRVIATAANVAPVLPIPGGSDPGVLVLPYAGMSSTDMLVSEIAPHLASGSAYWWAYAEGAASSVRVSHA